MTPDRPDETLAPLLTMTEEQVAAYDIAGLIVGRFYAEIQAQRRLSAEKDAKLTEMTTRYNELIFAVESRFPNETRHETALKYIRRCEQVSEGLSQNASAKPTEAP